MSDNSNALKYAIAAESAAMLKKVKAYMQEAACLVYSEGASVAGHAARLAYAAKILAGTASVYEMSMAVCMNPTIQAAIAADEVPSDGDIQYVVRTERYNAMAGVEAEG